MAAPQNSESDVTEHYNKIDYAESFTVFRRTAAQTFDDPKDVALAHAACRGDLTAMDGLIGNGANPNAISKDRSVAMLRWVMECQGLTGFEALLKAKADPNARLIHTEAFQYENVPDGPVHRNQYGYTMVTFAAGIGLPDYLKLLLKYGGDPNARENDSNALIEAVRLGPRDHFTNYHILLNAGADINAVIDLKTVVDELWPFHNYDKIAELLQRGYHYRLDRLASHLQGDNFFGIKPEERAEGLRRQVEWAAKVKIMLEERGITFPVKGFPVYTEAEYKAEEARRAENAKKPGGILMNP